MQTLTYTRPHRLDKLTDELVAAFPAWRGTEAGTGLRFARFQVSDHGDDITLLAPDEADPAAVAAVVNAHDASLPSAAEQQATADGLSLAELRDQYQAMLTRAQAIQAQMVGTPTNAQVRDAVKDLAVGMERMLKALRVLTRRQGG